MSRSASAQSNALPAGNAATSQNAYMLLTPNFRDASAHAPELNDTLLSSSLTSTTETIRPSPMRLASCSPVDDLQSQPRPDNKRSPEHAVDIPTIELRRPSTQPIHLPDDEPEGPRSFALRRPRLYASLQALALFLVSLVALYILLRTLLPPIAKHDRASIKLPRSFEDLKELNRVLQVRQPGGVRHASDLTLY